MKAKKTTTHRAVARATYKLASSGPVRRNPGGISRTLERVQS